jgi:hypothetical protein
MTEDNDKQIREDRAMRVYRKLYGFYQQGTAVHFRLIDGGDAGLWRNGMILTLDITSLTMILNELVLGEIPFLLEEIDEDSIVKYTTKVEWENRQNKSKLRETGYGRRKE